jgi:hypothetical protein
MAIDTSKVVNRRKLHFDTIEEILADVEGLNRGKFKMVGNWSGGQILRHLTIVMNGSIDGSPIRLGWPLRMIGRLTKKRMLAKGMKPGLQLPAVAAKGLVPAPISWEEAIAGFRQAIHRQQSEPDRKPHGFFGPMTRDEWNRLHCHHAALHLSFLVPETATDN